MPRRYHADGDQEFQEREGLLNLGETSPESHPEHQQQRGIVMPSSPAPRRVSEGYPGNIPVGRFFQKRFSPPRTMPVARATPAAPPSAPPARRPPRGPDRECCTEIGISEATILRVFEFFRSNLLKTQRPSWIDPPVRSFPIDLWSALGGHLSPPLSTGVSVIRATFTVPSGHIGFVTKLGQSVSSVDAWDDITWYVTKNGVKIPYYSDITMQLGEPSSPTVFATPIILRPGDVLDFKADNADVAKTYTLYGRLMGWFFPVQLLTSDGSYREMIVD